MADSERVPTPMNKWGALTAVILVGGLLVAGVWLRSGLIGSERWPVRWLDVEGDLERTSAAQVRAAAVGPASAGFFAADLETLQTAVEALPWVASAAVGRDWPDVLHIRVIEHRPVARWNGHRLMSDRGEVFEVSGNISMQGMVELAGPETRREEVLEHWLAMRRRLASVGLDIERLAVDERGAWTVELDSGKHLALGREHMHERLARFVRVHDQLRAQGRPIVGIDLRYPNGLSVRWADKPIQEIAYRG